MKVNSEKSGDIMIVAFQDDALDANNTKEFKENIAPILDTNLKVAFDLSKLEFVDSSGLGAILSCLRKLNSEGGDLKLFGVTKPVRALFELVRMHRIFDIFNTKEEAIKAFEL